MRRPSLIGARERRGEASRPGADLPPGHPLLHASEAVAYTARQCLHVAAVLTGSLIALVQSDRWAVSLAYSAASVLIVLTGLLFAHVQRERDCAIELILEGRDGLAIAPVQRQRKRLLAEGTREHIIAELEDALHQVRRASTSFSLTPPRFERAVVTAVTDELHDVVRLLGDGGCSTRVIASAERLVEQATSPLYGQDVNALRDELRRLCGMVGDRGM